MKGTKFMWCIVSCEIWCVNWVQCGWLHQLGTHISGRKSAMASISKTTRRDFTKDKTQTVRINWINVNVRRIKCLFPISPALHTISIRSSSGTLKESQCHAHACQISSIDVKLIRVMRPAIVDDLMTIWHHYTYEVAYTDGTNVCWAKKWLLK